MTDTTKPIKILLVDDDKFLLDMYAQKFKKAGFTVDTIPSSVQALEKIKSGEVYDIILLDIIMPGLDGIGVLQGIRADKLLPHAVIMMLTNSPDEFDKAKDLHVDGYIVKATSIPSEVVSKVTLVYKRKNTTA